MTDKYITIKEQKDFYPFGKEHENSNLMTSTNRWGYNGKEKQTIKDLGYWDYSARMLDSETGRWFVIDPLAEKYYSISPYVYCGNNPLRFIDPNGMDWYSYEEKYKDENGEEQTRTQYKYVQGTMSDDEMKEGGYTHLGKTYITDDTYYSLGGATLTYDSSNPFSMMGLQSVMSADASVIATVNAIEGTADFWNKYHNFVGRGSEVATIIGDFMDYSKNFRGVVKWTGYITTVPQAIKDAISLSSGTMDLNSKEFADAVFNVVSLAGTYGAAISLGYNAAKAGAKGFNQLEKAANKKFWGILKNAMTPWVQ